MTVGELKCIIQNLPDDAIILQQDPFSEYSYDIVGIHKSYSGVDVIHRDGSIRYSSLSEDGFIDLLEDNPEDEDKIREEYKVSLVIDTRD